MKKLIGIILIILAVYSNISFFANTPPFNTDEKVYTYQITETTDQTIALLLEPKKEVTTFVPLQNPEEIGLKLTKHNTQ